MKEKKFLAKHTLQVPDRLRASFFDAINFELDSAENKPIVEKVVPS